MIGGGRWGRVHVSVLSSLLGAEGKIFWVSSYCLETNKAWLQEQNISSVTLLNDAESLPELTIDGMVVATASHSHPIDVEKALCWKIPVLSEKPFALDAETANQLSFLAKEVQVPVGVNFEYMEATYLHQFKALLEDVLSKEQIQEIEIQWHDPLFETRHGELKTGDFGTPIAHDQGGHCWSLLKVLLEDVTLLEVVSGTAEPDGLVTVLAQCHSVEIRLLLHRRAPQRVRKISVNQGMAVLDFSIEPGWTKIGAKEFENTWTSHRPLKAALIRFLEYLSNRSSDWPCALERTLPAVYFCEAIHQKLVQQQQHRLTTLRQIDSLDETNPNLQWLLVDWAAPQMAAQGQRVQVYPESARIDFIRQALSVLETFTELKNA